MSEKKLNLILYIVAISLLLAGCNITNTNKPYIAKELKISEVKSEVDADGDGIDDFTDIMEGARAYIETNPHYKSNYYNGGYPDDGNGVCTDVIWQAFKAAGYDLKELVDTDIKNNTGAYDGIKTPDSNIDFRRVPNLNIFFRRNAEVLTNSLKDPQEWQAGDIVVFTKHIAICSDKRNKEGIPFIIHHNKSGAKEENKMKKYRIVGHYRWSAK